jgi:flagellar P-ring protein precursor FlgI
MRRPLAIALALLALGLGLLPMPARAARVKDLVDVEGIRANQLSGYGIVLGLDGTGDGQQSLFTIQSVLSMLRRRGVVITVDPRQIRVENAAAVAVTATLPPFARAGSRIDVQLASIGDAESLRGGTLVMTPLFGGDQQVYAVAQGPVSLGGGFSSDAPGASATSGHPTAGVIPAGAIVEREVPVLLGAEGVLRLGLRQPDVTTVRRITAAINDHAGTGMARTLDPGTVEVQVPPGDQEEAMRILAGIELLDVVPDRAARVVVNERTGTVIMGQDVRIAPVAIAHGALQVTVKVDLGVSQPAPFSEGETVVVPDSTLVVEEGQAERLTVLETGVSLGDLVGGLNALGVTPQDLIAVLQAIKTAGALDADLEMM